MVIKLGTLGKAQFPACLMGYSPHNPKAGQILAQPQRKEMQQLCLNHKSQNKHDFKAKDISYRPLSKKYLLLQTKRSPRKTERPDILEALHHCWDDPEQTEAHRPWQWQTCGRQRGSGGNPGARDWNSAGLKVSPLYPKGLTLNLAALVSYTWSRRGTALPVPSSREGTPPAVPGLSWGSPGLRMLKHTRVSLDPGDMTGKPKANHRFPVSRKLGEKKLWLTAEKPLPQVPAAKFPAFLVPQGSHCRRCSGNRGCRSEQCLKKAGNLWQLKPGVSAGSNIPRRMTLIRWQPPPSQCHPCCHLPFS